MRLDTLTSTRFLLCPAALLLCAVLPCCDSSVSCCVVSYCSATGDTHGINGSNPIENSGGDFVWVTVEYRLHVFGFLGSEALRSRDPQRSIGNFGLQDQRLALRWVQENIEAFGGDKANVMIDGCSAVCQCVFQLSLRISSQVYI